MTTDKQRNSRIRNRLLWRLRGMLIGLDLSVCTDEEVDKITKAQELIKEVLDNSVESSIELGFNAKHKCKSCGKPVAAGIEYCPECNDIKLIINNENESN